MRLPVGETGPATAGFVGPKGRGVGGAPGRDTRVGSFEGVGPTVFGTQPGETGPAVRGLIRPYELRDLSTSVEVAGDPGGLGGEMTGDETNFGFWTLGALRPLDFGRSCLRIF